MQAMEGAVHRSTEEEQQEEKRRHDAAAHIQKAWRHRMRQEYLGSDFLWSDVAVNARMKQVDRDAAEEGKNDSRNRWRRGVFLAGRLQDGDDMLSRGESVHPEAARKHLETQHWLELIDGWVGPRARCYVRLC
ncbi:hypothetical protein BD414DRAFT_420574 [Trametes punicea]|nr:hypothetical protein BD414DRAFT_420574 [Trametes punicea]